MTPMGTARFRLWEHAFFAGTVGALILSPAVYTALPTTFANPWTVFLLTFAAILSFLSAASYSEAHSRGSARWIIAAAISFGAAIIAAGYAASFSSPLLAAWCIDIAMALFSFGYLITKHLSRRADRDFLAHAPELVAIAVIANITLVLVITAAMIMPSIGIACAATALFLVAFLP